MKRQKELLLGGSILLGIFAAGLTDSLVSTVAQIDPVTRYLLDLLVTILAAGVPMAYLVEPASSGSGCGKAGEWMILRLTEEGYDALRAIMATEGDLTEEGALVRLLVMRHQALQSNLPGS